MLLLCVLNLPHFFPPVYLVTFSIICIMFGSIAMAPSTTPITKLIAYDVIFLLTACPPLYRLSGLSLKQTHSHKFGKSSYCIRYLFWCPINVPGIIYVTCAVTILHCFYDHLHHLSNMYVLRFVLVAGIWYNIPNK